MKGAGTSVTGYTDWRAHKRRVGQNPTLNRNSATYHLEFHFLGTGKETSPTFESQIWTMEHWRSQVQKKKKSLLPWSLTPKPEDGNITSGWDSGPIRLAASFTYLCIHMFTLCFIYLFIYSFTRTSIQTLYILKRGAGKYVELFTRFLTWLLVVRAR